MSVDLFDFFTVACVCVHRHSQYVVSQLDERQNGVRASTCTMIFEAELIPPFNRSPMLTSYALLFPLRAFKRFCLHTPQERNRRAWAGRTSNHPLSYPQAQPQKTTMWGFDTSGLANTGGTVSSGATTPAANNATPPPNGDAVASPPRGGREGGGHNLRRKSEGAPAAGTTRLRRLRTRLTGAGGGEGGPGTGKQADPPPLAAVAAPEDAPAAGSSSGMSGTAEPEGAPRWRGWGGGASGGESSSDEDEGRWESPRDSRGSSSKKRESKTSFHDGVLEVVAVEGVLHLGQIQVSPLSALGITRGGVGVAALSGFVLRKPLQCSLRSLCASFVRASPADGVEGRLMRKG